MKLEEVAASRAKMLAPCKRLILSQAQVQLSRLFQIRAACHGSLMKGNAHCCYLEHCLLGFGAARSLFRAMSAATHAVYIVVLRAFCSITACLDLSIPQKRGLKAWDRKSGLLRTATVLCVVRGKIFKHLSCVC
jgi:hypothetical protein